MKFFADFHHTGFALGLALLMHRLGHELCFPSTQWACEIQRDYAPGLWNTNADLIMLCGDPNGNLADIRNEVGWYPAKYLMSRQQFLETKWDGIIVTRTESMRPFFDVLAQHPNKDTIKLLAATGNDGGGFDYARIPNLMSSSLATFEMAPPGLHKIHYSQEIGPHYQKPFVPITEANLHTIHCYLMYLRNYQAATTWDGDIGLMTRCPHCLSPDGRPAAQMPTWPMWQQVRERLPGYTMRSYGSGSEEGAVLDSLLPERYENSALTFHYKHCEGYGFSLLQSVIMGRPVLCQKRMYHYRTAGRYLIPNVTCFETDWHPEAIAEAIQYVTANLTRANEYATACYRAAQGLFQWDHEAFRIREFLEDLR